MNCSICGRLVKNNYRIVKSLKLLKVEWKVICTDCIKVEAKSL